MSAKYCETPTAASCGCSQLPREAMDIHQNTRGRGVKSWGRALFLCGIGTVVLVTTLLLVLRNVYSSASEGRSRSFLDEVKPIRLVGAVKSPDGYFQVNFESGEQMRIGTAMVQLRSSEGQLLQRFPVIPAPTDASPEFSTSPGMRDKQRHGDALLFQQHVRRLQQEFQVKMLEEHLRLAQQAKQQQIQTPKTSTIPKSDDFGSALLGEENARISNSDQVNTGGTPWKAEQERALPTQGNPKHRMTRRLGQQQALEKAIEGDVVTKTAIDDRNHLTGPEKTNDAHFRGNSPADSCVNESSQSQDTCMQHADSDAGVENVDTGSPLADAHLGITKLFQQSTAGRDSGGAEFTKTASPISETQDRRPDLHKISPFDMQGAASVSDVLETSPQRVLLATQAANGMAAMTDAFARLGHSMVAAPLSIASSIDAAGQLLASPIAPLMTVPVSTPNYSIYPYGTFHSVPPFGCPPGDPYCTSYGYY